MMPENIFVPETDNLNKDEGLAKQILKFIFYITKHQFLM